MLKLNYDSKADIPKGAESFYTEKDGKFTLQVEGAKSQADVENLQNALDKERKLKREAEAQNKKYEEKFGNLPDDFSLEEYNNLKDANSGQNVDAKLKEQRERLTAQFNKDLAAKDKIIAEKDGLVNTHIKDGTLTRVIAESGIAKQFIPAVTAMMKGRVKLEGSEVYLDEKPIAEAMKGWVESEEGKHYVAAPINGGGGDKTTTTNADGTKKTMPRSEFDAQSPEKRMELSKAGITLTQ